MSCCPDVSERPHILCSVGFSGVIVQVDFEYEISGLSIATRNISQRVMIIIDELEECYARCNGAKEPNGDFKKKNAISVMNHLD